MKLEQRDKELAAIGASIGANCRPCIQHHIPAGRQAGLSESELNDAVTIAHAVRTEAVALLAAKVDELLGQREAPPEPSAIKQTSKTRELVALGASLGTNSHPLLHLHIGAALDVGLTASQVEAALKMAAYVQQHANGMTTEKARLDLEEVSRAGAATT